MSKLSLLKQYLINLKKSQKNSQCPYCHRILPNPDFKRKWGCPWCVPEQSTEFCNGTY